MDHALQPAVAGHVDAVVVARTQVEGRELAVPRTGRRVRHRRRPARWSNNCALGLEDLVTLDATELADRAIDRTDEVGISERTGAGFEARG